MIFAMGTDIVSVIRFAEFRQYRGKRGVDKTPSHAERDDCRGSLSIGDERDYAAALVVLEST